MKVLDASVLPAFEAAGASPIDIANANDDILSELLARGRFHADRRSWLIDDKRRKHRYDIITEHKDGIDVFVYGWTAIFDGNIEVAPRPMNEDDLPGVLRRIADLGLAQEKSMKATSYGFNSMMVCLIILGITFTLYMVLGDTKWIQEHHTVFTWSGLVLTLAFLFGPVRWTGMKFGNWCAERTPNGQAYLALRRAYA